VDENRKETADALAGFVPNVIVTHPLAPLDNLALYRQIGNAFDVSEKAEAFCARFENEYDKIKSRSFKPVKVLYLIWKYPWMTVSRDTYISRMLALFGLQTLPEKSDARYPELKDLGLPGTGLILLSTEPYRFRDADAKGIQSRTGVPTRLIDGEMTSWYGPRAIEGLRYLSDFAAAL
jgi:hypothetical protein